MSHGMSKTSRREFLKWGAVVGGGAVLAACVPATPQPTAGTPTAPTAAAGPVSVVWWAGENVQYEPVERDIAANFNNQRTDVQINMLAIPGAGYGEKLTTSIAAGEGPDVFRSIFIPATARHGHLEDLTPYIERDNLDRETLWFAGAWQPYLYEGRQYGVPRDYGFASWAYNADLFDQAGLSYPEAGWSLDDAVAAMEAIDALGEDIWGTANAGSAALLWGAGALAYNTGAEIISRDGRQVQGVLDSPTTIEMIQWLLDLEERKLAVTGEQARALRVGGYVLASGKVGLATASTWESVGLRELPFRWAPCEPPVKEGYERHAWSGAVQFHMWSGSKVKDAAWEVLKYLSGPEATRIAAKAGIYASPCPVVWEEEGLTTDPFWRWYLEQAALPTDIPAYNRSEFYWDCVGSNYADIWTRYLQLGERPLEAIVQDAAQKSQVCLDEAWAAEQP